MCDNRIVVSLVEEDYAELERAAYEASTAEKLIDYFVSCAKKHDAEDLLLKIIDGYRSDFAKAVMHRDMLLSKLVEEYFPYEKGWAKEQTKYNIDFERGELVFCHVETTAQLQ